MITRDVTMTTRDVTMTTPDETMITRDVTMTGGAGPLSPKFSQSGLF